MTRTAFDAAYPPASAPAGATTACIYIGGDTPNPIANPASVPAYQGVTFWLPVWVRSDPTPAVAHTDGLACARTLDALGAPSTCSVVLDLETAVTPSYVTTFATLVAPHPVLPYGSRSTLTQNPRCGGHFLAWPTWTGNDWPSGVVAIQHTYAGSYDLSSVQTSAALWDRRKPVAPVVTAPSAPTTTGAGCAVVEVTTGADGNGWTETTIPWASFLGATCQGSDPGVDGTYWPGSAQVQERTGNVLVTVTGCRPNVVQTVFVART